jgi:hypothetical protein
MTISLLKMTPLEKKDMGNATGLNKIFPCMLFTLQRVRNPKDYKQYNTLKREQPTICQVGVPSRVRRGTLP